MTVRNGQATWQPESAVVLDGSDTSAGDGCRTPDNDGECTVAAADRCCHVMNFFTSADSANAWLAEHPQVSGVILTKDQALRASVDIFGHLLHD